MELAKPIADELGYIIWDLEFIKEGSTWILRVTIDKEGGVSIEDCENMSRPLDKKLDEVDPIEQSYCLEVSSAGIERELSKKWHFDWARGNDVVVKLTRPDEETGEREFIGEVLEYNDEGNVIVKIDGKEKSFNEKNVAYVRMYTEF